MTALKTLRATISSVIPGIRWSLADLPTPLHYEPLEKLQKIRRSEQPKYELFLDIPASIDNLFSSSTTESRHYGMIALGLLLLGHDYVDECHDIVLALSWPSSMGIT